ncbi:hypothetical protein [Embleya scabrispora]|uniref:hypothetical protein n=1 Tax=Embleya scabrispora TaxID=159449 RepID=UPI001319C86F|nr:hypothetical protein [Embleya scabrispora]MYS87827.1 hypothetical protein [Streptomyces sp. SID5474]
MSEHHLTAEVVVATDDDKTAEDIAQKWFGIAIRRFSNEPERFAKESPKPFDFPSAKWGDLSKVFGSWSRSHRDAIPVGRAPLGREGTADAARFLSHGYSDLSLTLFIPAPPGETESDGRWAKFDFEAEWPVSGSYRVSFSIEEDLLLDREHGKATQDFLVDLLREFSTGLDTRFGQIGYWQSLGRTGLEMSLPFPYGNPARNRLVDDEMIRGYSWITMFPESIADRLGGFETFAAESLHEVSRIPGGGILVRACEDYRNYYPGSMRELWRILSPVLPPSTPREAPLYPGESPLGIVYSLPVGHAKPSP